MVKQLFILLSLFFTVAAFAATPTITLQGRITKPDGTAFAGSTQFRVQILSPVEQCVLYDETQTKTLADGLFTLSLNDDSLTSDPTNNYRNDTNSWSFQQALSNKFSFAVPASKCASGSGTVMFTPSATDERKVLVQFKDSTMTTWDSLPVAALTHSASAIDSVQVGGFASGSLLRVEDSGIPGAATSFTSSDFLELKNLIAGTSAKYAQTPSSASTSTVNFNGERLTNVGTPTGSGDATNKSYVDSNLAATALDTTGIAALTNTVADQGKVLSWDGLKWTAVTAASQWANQTGSAISYTAGNVGIGTTSPTAKLDVTGSTNVTGNTNVSYNLADDTGSLIGVFEKTTVTPTANSAAQPASNWSDLVLNGTNNYTGTITGSTTRVLDYTSGTSTNVTGMLATVQNRGAGTVTSGTALNANASNTSTGTIATATAISAAITNSAGGTITKGIGVLVGAAPSTGTVTDYYSIYSTSGKSYFGGNVGIGTTSPSYPLDIYTSSGNAQVRVQTAAVSNAATVMMANGTRTWEFGANGWNAGAGNFSIGATGGLGAAVSILGASGNVGIGTTSPLTKLEVAGTLKVGNGAEVCSSTTYAGMIRYNSPNIEYCNGTSWQVMSSGTSGVTNTAGITSSGSITLTPGAANSVVISNAQDSSGTSSGALVVGGGIGASGNIYASGSLNGASVAAPLSYIPQLYGSSTTGNLKIDGNQTGTGNVLLATNGGKVGIGTTSPTAKLDVTGDVVVSNTSNLSVRDNTGTARSFATIDAFNSMSLGSGANGNLRIGDNAIGVEIGGIPGNPASKLSIYGNASVGTGYATTAAPTNGLIIQGTVGIGTTAPGGSLDVFSANGRQFQVLDAGASTVNYLTAKGATTTNSPTVSAAGSDTNVSLNFQTQGSGMFRFNTGGGSQLKIFDRASAVNYFTMAGGATGGYPNLAVQGTDTNVNMQLSTQGTGQINFTSGNGAQFRIFDPGTGAVVNSLAAVGAVTGSPAVLKSYGTDTNVDIKITPQGTGSSYFSSGNVGIGTTAPSNALDIVQSGNGSSAGNIQILNPGAATQAVARFIASTGGFGTTTLAATGQSYSSATIDVPANSSFLSAGNGLTLLSTANNTSSTIRFHTSGSLPANERMRIDSSGNVGIGTTSPGSKLQVNGTIVSPTTDIATGASVDLSTSNTFTLDAVGGSAITLTNAVNGGNYTLVMVDTTSRMYTFTGCTNSYFKPANAATTTLTQSIYNILTIKSGATVNCYITWATGYQ